MLAAERANRQPLSHYDHWQNNETYGTGRELRELQELINTRTNDLKNMADCKHELCTRWREWKALDDAYKPYETWLSKNVSQRFSESARSAEEKARRVRDLAYERYTQTMYHERTFRHTRVFDNPTHPSREITPLDKQFPPQVGGYRDWKEAESDWAAKERAWTAELKATQEQVPVVAKRDRTTHEALVARENAIERTMKRHYNSEPVMQRYEERLRSRLWIPSEAKAARALEAATGGRAYALRDRTYVPDRCESGEGKSLDQRASAGLLREQRLGPYREARNAGTIPRGKEMDKELRSVWRQIREERDPAFKSRLDDLEYARYSPGRQRVRRRVRVYDPRDFGR